MPDHSGNFRIGQLCRSRCTLFRVCCIVLRQQFELDGGASNRQVLGIEVGNRVLGTCLVVLAQMGDCAGQRTDVTNLDHSLRAGRNCDKRERRGNRSADQTGLHRYLLCEYFRRLRSFEPALACATSGCSIYSKTKVPAI